MHLAEGGPGIAFEFVGIAEEQDGDVPTRRGERARGDESISSVVAFAAENGDAAGVRVLAFDETGNRLSRVAHENNGRNGEPLAGGAVGGTHFFSRDDRDGGNQTHEVIVPD